MKQILFLILSLFLFVSCSKNEDSETETEIDQGSTTCTVKIVEHIFIGATVDKLFFTYNDKGKVTRIDHGSQNSNDYETFDYQPDKIVSVNKVNGKSETLTFNLDANSRIISVGDITFKYNTDGYLIESKEIKSGVSYTITCTYTSGNLTKLDYLTTYSSGGTSKYSRTFEYNTDAYLSYGGFGSALADIDYNKYGFLNDEFLGKKSKNQIHSFATDSGDPGVYTYQKDDQGKVISRKYYSHPDTTEFKLTYDCK